MINNIYTFLRGSLSIGQLGIQIHSGSSSSFKMQTFPAPQCFVEQGSEKNK